MPRPSWLRRSKKPEGKAAAITSLASSASTLVITPRLGPSNASSVPLNNAKSRGSLWDKAYVDLQTEKENLVDAFEKLLLSEPETQSTSTLADGDPSKREKQMSALVAKKLDAMKQEQWKLQIGGKSIEVRQQVDRIVKVVLVGKEFITSAASMDPIHAGLPWAGVCMLLPLITKDSEERTAATDGLEYISGLIRRYTEIEQIYLGDEDFQLKSDLESLITKLYRHVLEYEARAACQFNRNTAYQWARNVVEADSWKAIIGTIKDLEAACDKLTWVIDAKDQRVRATRLESYLGRQNHEVRELFRVSREQEEEQAKLQLAELKAGRQEQEEQAKLHLAELKAGRQELEDRHRKAEESACYECLRTTDYESNKNKNPVRIPGTCEWFLRHPRYRKWLDEQGSTWLWVTADPGCGKSVLSRFLVDEYKTEAKHANTICYYFFKDDSEEGRSATHALCAILHQLFSQNNKLLRHGIPGYRRNGNKLPQLFNELWNIFMSAVADPDAGSVVCIVDALDECAESARLPLIRALARYYQNPELTTKLKFIIVSRPYSSIGDAFWEENPNVASVQLMGESEAEMEAIRVEIDLVITEKVKLFNSRRLRKGVVDDAHLALQKELRGIENRTYLWVALIFPELEKKAGLATSKLLQLIKTIPKSVDEAYERILNQSSDRAQARKLLHIVVAAKRPLNLTEMNIALSMKEGATSMEDLELEPEQSFEKTVRELCGLFVVIRDSTVILIHQTAKEFLVAENTTSDPATIVSGQEFWRHSLEPAKSNHDLAMICIAYLSFDVFESNPLVLKEEDGEDQDEEDSEDQDSGEDEGSEYDSSGSRVDGSIEQEESNGYIVNRYLEEHPFLYYAAHNWPSHFREAESLEDPATLKAALKICTSHSERLRTWFSLYRLPRQGMVQECPRDITDLMLASKLGLNGMVKAYLEQGAGINLKDTVYGLKPLLYAAEAGHGDIVTMLLEKCVNPNIQDKNGHTALIKAVNQNQKTIVNILLKSSADSNIQDKTGETALMIATIRDCESIVKMLLESKADPNIQDKDGETALIKAAIGDQERTMKMLLESKADPNIQDKDGETALIKAAFRDQERTVKMLLESNADPNIQDRNGETALTRAAYWGLKTVVKMLLESRADANIQDNYGQTALIKAARKGREMIVKMLLQSRADPNIQDRNGETALITAANKGHGMILKMLLELGANAKVRNNRGKTAFMITKEKQAIINAGLQEKAEPPKLVVNEGGAPGDNGLSECYQLRPRAVDRLLAQANRLQAMMDMLLEHETESAEDNDGCSTIALTDTPGQTLFDNRNPHLP